MPLPAYRNRNHRRDRSRIGLLLSSSRSQRRKTTLTLLALTSLAVFYSYAFFGGQPDRSFGTVHRLNEELKARAKRRQELLRRKRNGEYVPELEEMDEEGMPEWQRRIRAGAAGELVWKQEQESWLGTGEEEEEETDTVPTNLRGTKSTEKDTEGDSDKSKNQRQRRKRTSAEETTDFIVMLTVFALTRALVRVCVMYRQLGESPGALGAATTATTATTTTTTTPSRNNSGRAALARLMVPQSIHAHATLLRTARFRAWVTNLNRERAQNGQPPLSMDSLRLVLRDSDFSGNDYEALMRFNEEATLAQSMGATQAEIDRWPQRVLEHSSDDLLTTPDHHVHPHHRSNNSNNTDGSQGRPAQQCPICLEAYQLQDRVRTIPCFHEFHVDCIDPWLAHKAACPICKHPVVG